MKRINDKGFAISTLLYALVLMMFLIVFALMATLGSTRKNTRNLVDAIDDELNRYGLVNQIIEWNDSIDSTGEGRIYSVLEDGYYYIELYGAQNNRTTGWEYDNDIKNGSFISGVIYLKAHATLYIHLGSKSSNDNNNSYINYEYDDSEYKIMEAPGGPNETNSYGGRTKIKDKAYLAIGYAGSKIDSADNNRYQTTPLSNDDPRKDLYFKDVKYYRYVNSGVGKFKIKKVSDVAIENHKLTHVQYVKDCIRNSTISGHVAWTEIQAIDRYTGTNVALGATPTIEGAPTAGDGNLSAVTDGEIEKFTSQDFYSIDNTAQPTQVCLKINLGTYWDLSEVAVWHFHADSDTRKYRNNTIQVSVDGENWNTIKSTSYSAATTHGSTNVPEADHSDPETIVGKHISAYQPQEYKNGLYMIKQNYETRQNKFLTFKDSKASFSTYTGDDNQLWEIEYSDITGGIYITEGKNLSLKNKINKCYLGYNNTTIICDNTKHYFTLSSFGSNLPYTRIYEYQPSSGAYKSLTTSGTMEYNPYGLNLYEFVKVNK